MRRAITFLLLAATAASPLAAQAWGGPGQGPARADRGPGGPGDRPGPPGDGRAPDRDAPGGPRPDIHGDRPDWRGPDRAGPGIAGGRVDRPDWRASPGDPRARERGDWRGPPGGWRDGGPDPRAIDRRGGWNTRWRDDHRYDWRGYRDGNRAVYRAPRYYGPRGDRYSRWSPGYRVQPYYYGRNYWIADPWRYRLPPAYGSYRWVRYYDDVALIDVRSGLIEDIIYGFFWR